MLFTFVVILALNKPLYWSSRRLVKERDSEYASVIVDRLNTANETVCNYVPL